MIHDIITNHNFEQKIVWHEIVFVQSLEKLLSVFPSTKVFCGMLVKNVWCHFESSLLWAVGERAISQAAKSGFPFLVLRRRR
jgi:hypothetical protein